MSEGNSQNARGNFSLSFPNPSGFQRRHAVAIAGFIAFAIFVPLLLVQCTGVMDFRFFDNVDSSTSDEPTPSAQQSLQSPAPESQVEVIWQGVDDAIEISWPAMNYADLHWYSVDVYGLWPVQTWYNVAYRLGDELRTSATTNPISLANEKLGQEGSPERVTNDETWLVCVTGMIETPLGVDPSAYVIQGSEHCSDPFSVPR